MSQKFDAVVAGHICLDIIPGFRNAPGGTPEFHFKPGHLIEVGNVAVSTGGPVANTGLALHKLGISTNLMGKIGDDLFGRAITEVLSSYGNGLSLGMIRDDSVNTSYTVILNPPGVDRMFFHFPGANDTFCSDDIQMDTVKEARLFHFGYPPVMRRMYENDGSELRKLFSRVKETGVTTSLDMTLPDPASTAGKANWKAILRTVLPFVDIFLPSLEEILFMLKPDSPLQQRETPTPSLLSELSDELLTMGSKIVGIKLGDKGFYLRTAPLSGLTNIGRAFPAMVHLWADRQVWVPCFDVAVAGTTGAGDATIAGFLSALLKGCSIEEVVTTAVAVGACCVEASDATQGIRTWDETRRRIASGWKRHELALSAPEWRWLEQEQLWSRETTTG